VFVANNITSQIIPIGNFCHYDTKKNRLKKRGEGSEQKEPIKDRN